MAKTLGRVFLVFLLAGRAAISLCEKTAATATKAPGKEALGRESVLLQAAAEMSRSQGVSSQSAAAGAGHKRRQQGACSLFAPGPSGPAGCSAASWQTKGSNRIQTKTKISKVMLDLSEEDDY